MGKHAYRTEYKQIMIHFVKGSLFVFNSEVYTLEHRITAVAEAIRCNDMIWINS